MTYNGIDSTFVSDKCRKQYTNDEKAKTSGTGND
jgi:hypothetical protein